MSGRMVIKPAAIAMTTVMAFTSVPAFAADWNGSYVGARFGYGNLAEDLDGHGDLVGLHVGRDWGIDGSWVAGLSVDSSYSNVSAGIGDLDSLSRIKIRGGYSFGDTLAYVTTGSAYAASSATNDEWGYTIGIGLEHRISNNVSLFGEILEDRFDTSGGDNNFSVTTATFGLNYRF